MKTFDESLRRLGAGGIAVLSLAILPSGCSWFGKSGEKPAKLTSIASPMQVQVAWRLRVGDGRGSYFQPAVLANAVFAAASNGTVVRIDPATGSEVWKAKMPTRLGAGVGSDGFLVAVVGERGQLYVLTAEGKKSWEGRVPSDVVTPPLVGQGLVIVRSTDQSVSAFEAETGKRRWVYKRQTPPLTLRGPTEMLFSAESVIVGFPGGRVVCIALSNGAARWDSLVSEPKGATEVERLADVLGELALAEDKVCAASYQGRIACFDAAKGDEQWAREMAAGAGVAIGEGRVFGVEQGSTVRAYALSNGASLWSNKSLANRSLSSPGTLGRWLVLGDYQGYVHWLDRADGHLAGRVELDGSPVVAEPRATANGILVQTQRGSLALLVPQG
jgi:outer membrane protein assembly factor BamB